MNRIPYGWRLVPEIPSAEMLHAPIGGGNDTVAGWLDNHSAMSVYLAMLAASPSPPVPKSPWHPMDIAPKDRSILLWLRGGQMYIGRWRSGNLGEPSQGQIAWRCDSSGHYATPILWAERPSEPAPDEHPPIR